MVTNEMAATGGLMYTDEGSYTIDVRYVEEMVGRHENGRMATESGGDETATRPGTRPAVPAVPTVPAVPGTRPATRTR